MTHSVSDWLASASPERVVGVAVILALAIGGILAETVWLLRQWWQRRRGKR